MCVCVCVFPRATYRDIFVQGCVCVCVCVCGGGGGGGVRNYYCCPCCYFFLKNIKEEE